MDSGKKRKNVEDTQESLAKLFKPTKTVTPSSNLPRVVHLRRLKGKVVQDCDVYIGRACNMGGWRLPQSKWHNPYSVKQFGRDGALSRYRTYIESNANDLLDDLHELTGKTLGCWCSPSPCHGDILREFFAKQIPRSTKDSVE